MLAKGWMPERAIGGNAFKNQWMRSDIGLDASVEGHEMMLDTDLCLAFSEGREPLLARTEDCCAWLGDNAIPDVIRNNGGIHCGGDARGNAGQQRARCCLNNQGADDCGNRNDPRGPAAQSVLTFANDQSSWIQAFLQSWKTVTENGFQDRLKSLGQCPTRIPTESPTLSPTVLPTVEPTHMPSEPLTPSPSPLPTEQPTFKSTESATTSSAPSPAPIGPPTPPASTLAPTLAPETNPSSEPTAAPTDMPTKPRREGKGRQPGALERTVERKGR